MDPFFTAPTSASASRSRWSVEHNTPDPQSQPTNKTSVGLRRSAGLFNLKLGSPSKLRSIDTPIPSSPTTPTPDSLNGTNNHGIYASLQTPHASHSQTQVPQLPQVPQLMQLPRGGSNFGSHGVLTPDQTQQSLGSIGTHRKRGYSASLKRPHPFSSSKPAKQTGFLARSTANTTTPAAAPSKRLHADVSFEGARPVQTAFAPAGLLSKRHVVCTSPSQRVPETPCKRAPNDPSSTSTVTSVSFEGWDFENHHNHSQNDLLPPRRTPGPEIGHARTGEARIGDSRVGDVRLGEARAAEPTGSLYGDDSPVVSHCRAAGSTVSTPNPQTNAPIDRLQRFSIHNIEECEPPETPTRFGVHTSTPLARGQRVSSRAIPQPQNRQVLPGVLQSADPSDSLSLCPPGSIESTLLLNSSSMSDASMGSPQTPDDRSSPRMEPAAQASSPRPRQLRMFNLRKSVSETPNAAANSTANLGRRLSSNLDAPPPISLDTQQDDDAPIFRVSTPHTPGFPAHSSSSIAHSVGSISVSDEPSHLLFDEHLAQRFDRVQSAQLGEFSAVFVVVQGKQRLAVKRTKRPLHSLRERLRLREEVEVLRTLTTAEQQTADEENVAEDSHQSHIVQLIDEWESDGFGYILTEYCENGDLNRFLAAQGRVARLEEWRVWKILVEVLQGLAVVHEHGILHLDLKPANVFVTFEGHLKIGDFGMATRYPVPLGFEREGDREYIAPEVLERQQYGTSADIFSVGIMMVEVAANIVLPDNGVHWQRLRSGDLSDAGRLSSGDLASSLSSHSQMHPPSWAPRFLVDGSFLLDRIVSRMLSPQPELRPSAKELLELPELELVNTRGQAGAVVYEGEYGPEPEEEGEVWQRA